MMSTSRHVESIRTAPVRIPDARRSNGSFLAGVITGGALLVIAVSALIYGVGLL